MQSTIYIAKARGAEVVDFSGMTAEKRNLKGSLRHDAFKRKHKDMASALYAIDADLCLVSKRPPGIVAYLDLKTPGEEITFAEVITYNVWVAQAPVFVVESRDPRSGLFTIFRYLGGDWRPRPPACQLEPVCTLRSWSEFERWERQLRRAYQERGGWNGNLRFGGQIPRAT